MTTLLNRYINWLPGYHRSCLRRPTVWRAITPAHLSQLCSQLKEQLAEADRLSQDTRKENLHLANQMQAMTNKMDEMNYEIDSLQNQVGVVLEDGCGPRGWVWS